MSLLRTEKKYWVNGYLELGRGAFKTFSVSIGSYAVMFCWGRQIGVYFYKLT